MKTIRTTLLITLAASAISLARAEDNEAAKKDMAALQGEWSMVSGIADGQAIDDGMRKQMKRICKGDELSVTLGEQVIMKAKIALDPFGKPKTIDYDVTDGPNKGKKLLGIYELDGDTIKSCFAPPGAERPTDFTSKPGDKHTFSVWKRVKATDRKPE
jgi:uncharacterized protein (TIGR03067 family)